MRGSAALCRITLKFRISCVKLTTRSASRAWLVICLGFNISIMANLHFYDILSHSAQERAVLSTHVLKLEENIKELQAKLAGAMSDKDHLIQVSCVCWL